MRLLLVAVLLMGSCSSAPAPSPGDSASLEAIVREEKFRPTTFYPGVDAPEDRKPLEEAVNSAARDVNGLPKPLDPNVVRRRLARLVEEVDLFATEDREQAYRYAVRIWRAAGFRLPSAARSAGSSARG